MSVFRPKDSTFYRYDFWWRGNRFPALRSKQASEKPKRRNG